MPQTAQTAVMDSENESDVESMASFIVGVEEGEEDAFGIVMPLACCVGAMANGSKETLQNP